MLLALAVSGIALGGSLLAPERSAVAALPAEAPRSVVFSMRTMGTYANVTLVTADSAGVAAVAHEAQAEFARVDSLMSNWTTTSEVARINRAAWPGPTTVHPEVARVLAEALAVSRLSDGAEDITVEPLVRLWGFLGGKPHVPAESDVATAFRHVGYQKLAYDSTRRSLRFAESGVQIDLGGIAKGYAVDAAARRLEARGIRDALVDVSGNMRALG